MEKNPRDDIETCVLFIHTHKKTYKRVETGVRQQMEFHPKILQGGRDKSAGCAHRKNIINNSIN